MNNSSILNDCGVIGIDHVAVTTDDLVSTLRHYLALPNSFIQKGPGVNGSQNVRYAFVEYSGVKIEILSPEGDSPILSHIDRGAGAYHLCYVVNDIMLACDVAEKKGAKIVVYPREDEAFDGRKVAFLYHKDLGLFEFLSNSLPESFTINDKTNITESRGGGFDELFKRVLNLNEDMDLNELKINDIPEWNSTTHIILMMEIEEEFLISFTPDELVFLDSYKKIRSHLGGN